MSLDVTNQLCYNIIARGVRNRQFNLIILIIIGFEAVQSESDPFLLPNKCDGIRHMERNR